MTAIYLVLCVLAFNSAFCRIVLTSQNTDRTARVVFCSVGAASAFAIFSVLFWGYSPTVVDLVTEAACVAMMIVSSRRWKHGVPSEYESERGRFDDRAPRGD